MIDFLKLVFASLSDILSITILPGVSLYTFFFYNMFLISFWFVLTRK